MIMIILFYVLNVYLSAEKIFKKTFKLKSGKFVSIGFLKTSKKRSIFKS